MVEKEKAQSVFLKTFARKTLSPATYAKRIGSQGAV
jgi:hypothetical protein